MKRYGDFETSSNKKQKLEDDLDAMWGDDLDEDAIDNCIQLATFCEKTQNESILPSYNGFKNPNNVFCSTQVEASFKATTSRIETGGGEKEEIKQLREKLKEKEGEVAILRGQIKEARSVLHKEEHKSINEWKEKINALEKKNQSITSELEFKKLENANLKQKVMDVSKIKTHEMSFTQNVTPIKPKSEIVKPPVLKKECKKVDKKQVILEPYYPLKFLCSSMNFSEASLKQQCVSNWWTSDEVCKNTIPYLQNKNLYDNILKDKVVRTTFVDKRELTLEFAQSEMLFLMCCTKSELNAHRNQRHINKIVCVCLHFLTDLHEHLSELENNTRIETIQQMDSLYLDNKFDETSWDSDLTKQIVYSEGECGVQAAIALNFLAELMPFSTYLKDYICLSKPLVFHDSENVDSFPFMLNKQQISTYLYFLKLLLNIVKLIGRTRKSHVTSGFACSVLKLLINICKVPEGFSKVSDVFCEITKEIIFSRPRLRVIYELTFLLKVASRFKGFAEYLFNKPKKIKMKTNKKKGIFYYTEDSCRFHIFVILFENTIFKMKKDNIPITLFVNLLSFIYNTFKWSYSVYHEDPKMCECLPLLYKLEMEIVFNALEKYIEDNKTKKKSTDEWTHFFKHKITIKVLHLMTFNSQELTEKYVTVFSQYKEIERKLSNFNISDMEKLNISEEMPEISERKFAAIDFF